jgi:hypothetical protein
MSNPNVQRIGREEIKRNVELQRSRIEKMTP